jgi:uncharacterized protein
MTIRITDIQLPLDHDEEALIAAILSELGIARPELLSYTTYRRGYDARKRSAIHFIYSIDADVTDKAAVLANYQKKIAALPTNAKRTLSATPDMAYKFVAQAPDREFTRQVVIGTGPCGLFDEAGQLPRSAVDGSLNLGVFGSQ